MTSQHDKADTDPDMDKQQSDNTSAGNSSAKSDKDGHDDSSKDKEDHHSPEDHHHDGGHYHHFHVADVPHHHVKTVGWTGYLVFSAMSGVIGVSFMNGYHGAVVNAPYDVMQDYINDTFIDKHDNVLNESGLDTQWSLVVSLFMAGCIIGSFWMPDFLSKRFGRRNSMLYTTPLAIIGSILCFITPYTDHYLTLYIGRIILGIQNGITMVIVAAYLVELPPLHLRGACGTLNELILVVGISVANLIGLTQLLGTDDLWHYLMLFAMILYMIHAVMLYFSAESPRWLVDKGRSEDAKETLERLRSGATKEAIEAELEETEQVSKAEAEITVVSYLDFLRNRELAWPLFIAVNLHISQEFTGIVAVQSYATETMTNAGLDEDTAKIANFGVSIVNVVGTIFSALIVDRVGRRVLMLTSLVGMGVANIYLTIVMHYDQNEASIAGFAVFLLFFALGAGPIPWFMAAEMFIQAARPPALSVCLQANWITKLIVGLVFPHMETKMREYAFLPFAAFAAIEFVFLLLFMPETNGITIEEVAAKFERGQPMIQLCRSNKIANVDTKDEAKKPSQEA